MRTGLAGRIDPLTLAALPGRRDAAVVTMQGWTVVVGEPVAVVTDVAALSHVAERCGWRQEPDPDGPPFLGGAVGLLCDDAAHAWLHLPPDPRPRPAPLPAVRFGVYDAAVCLPPEGGPAHLVAADVPGYSREPAGVRLARLAGQVAAARTAPPASPCAAPPGPLSASLSRAAHRAAVASSLDWISAGSVYQLNLTLQVGAAWRADGPTFARALWQESPGAAHAAYLSVGDVDVVSVSPETFLRTRGRQVTVRPIKGTRGRGATARQDRAAASALCSSAKDRAEHVMIVDLERNDLGRVCRTGTVRVPDLAALEAHPTVWHLTSTVAGQLREGTTLTDLLAATFPCGSVTGAPKRMAVAHIRTLEPVRRGVYCGAIGAVSRGRLDLSVAIRTAVVSAGQVRYGTGGGIVADSDPDAEYDEAVTKAAAFLRAVGRDPAGRSLP